MFAEGRPAMPAKLECWNVGGLRAGGLEGWRAGGLKDWKVGGEGCTVGGPGGLENNQQHQPQQTQQEIGQIVDRQHLIVFHGVRQSRQTY